MLCTFQVLIKSSNKNNYLTFLYHCLIQPLEIKTCIPVKFYQIILTHLYFTNIPLYPANGMNIQSSVLRSIAYQTQKLKRAMTI